MRTLRTCVILLCLALSGALLPTTAASGAASETGTFYPLTSGRFLDTRNGVGGPTSKLAAGGTLSVQVAGRGGIPTAGVAAVVLNITATGGTATSYLTAYPSGTTRPGVSSLNFTASATRANGATVKLGTDGKVAIFNAAGSVNVIVDVLGYYASSTISTTTGTEFDTYGPDRLTDTRSSAEGQLKSKEVLTVDVDFDGGASNSYVKALAVNVTAVKGSGSGHLSLFNGGDTLPSTSTLNFGAAGAVANLTTVKTSLCTDCTAPAPVRFAVYNGSSASVDVIVDLVGIYYNDGSVGLRFRPLTPVRVSDSRKPLNGTTMSAGQTQTLTAPTAVGTTTVATSDTMALVSNLTAIAPTASTFLTVWKDGDPRPGVSNINADARATVANAAIVPLATTRKFDIYNSAGTTNFALDVSGRFDVGVSSSVQSAGVRRHFQQVTTSSQRSLSQTR